MVKGRGGSKADKARRNVRKQESEKKEKRKRMEERREECMEYYEVKDVCAGKRENRKEKGNAIGK